MLRQISAVALSCLAVGAAAASLPDQADARPRISSFYVKDEGRVIHMKVNFCDPTAAVSDSYSATFRMWNENHGDSIKVLQRRVSQRIGDSCGYFWLKAPDIYANGLYSANVAVTNRTRGSFSRIGARYFRIR